MDRKLSRTDPLQRVETFQYDSLGNVVSEIDRRGKKAAFNYDGLNRITFAGFGTTGSGANQTYESTQSLNFDNANRISSIVDSTSGTIVHGYNELDQLTSETTPQVIETIVNLVQDRNWPL